MKERGRRSGPKARVGKPIRTPSQREWEARNDVANHDIPVEEIGQLVQQFGEVFAVLGDKVPALLRGVIDILYSPEAGRRIGQSAGAFYKELTEAGIPPDRALQLAEAYLAPLRMLNSMVPGGQQ